MMNIPYRIDTYDNLLDLPLRQKILEYVRKQQWFLVWHGMPERIMHYQPDQGDTWFPTYRNRRITSIHRAPLASDVDGLIKDHYPIYLLWQKMNQLLDEKFELTGNPEGIVTYDPDVHNAPPPTDPNLKKGWRAYVNATMSSEIMGSGYAHRDTPWMDQDDTVTIIYFANLEWYPSWGGDLLFYPDDPEGVTGDHQQFNTYRWMQKRDFNIGWLDHGRTVSPVPGRFLIADGRCLHSTSSTAVDQPCYKVIFRARRKST